eukprot:1159210-Pelagomonas_calceolata.AAC.3
MLGKKKQNLQAVVNSPTSMSEQRTLMQSTVNPHAKSDWKVVGQSRSSTPPGASAFQVGKQCTLQSLIRSVGNHDH